MCMWGRGWVGGGRVLIGPRGLGRQGLGWRAGPGNARCHVGQWLGAHVARPTERCAPPVLFCNASPSATEPWHYHSVIRAIPHAAAAHQAAPAPFLSPLQRRRRRTTCPLPASSAASRGRSARTRW